MLTRSQRLKYKNFIRLIFFDLETSGFNIYHNQIIERIFSRARRKAWASISDKRVVQELILETRAGKIAQLQKRVNTANILNIYK